jgi:hypothetical protein
MVVRLVLPAAAVVAALAGVALAPSALAQSGNGESATAGCGGNSCVVTITVDGCASASIRPDLETIYVAPGERPVMQWRIAQSSFMMGWQFADRDGIFFKAAPAGEFTPQGSSPRVITINNRHTPPASSAGNKYEYGINIVRRGGSPGAVAETCTTKDPWVHNL